MKIIGILQLLAGALFLFMAVFEWSRYQALVESGNLFAGVVSNSATYLGGIGLIGVLAGIGFLIGADQVKAKP